MTSATEVLSERNVLSLVLTDPVAAREFAQKVLSGMQHNPDPAVESLAERALGLCCRELGDVAQAVAHLHRSARIARDAKLADLEVRSRIELAWLHVYRGDTTAALADLERLSGRVSGEDKGRHRLASAHVLALLGRLEQAVRCNTEALAIFRRVGDPAWTAACLNNRGLDQLEMGNLARAEADLSAAADLLAEAGGSFGMADVWWNQGLLAARKGDIPSALELYQRADDYYQHRNIPKPHLLLDKCELYLSARLLPEARQAAERAREELKATRRPAEAADATLMLCQTALLEGDLPTAQRMASLAIRAFARQRRFGWLVLARHAALQARWAGGDASATLLQRAVTTAAELRRAGWGLPEVEARIMAARIALHRADADLARSQLQLASAGRNRGPVQVRISSWHAAALLRLSDGDRRGAHSALRAGMRVLDQHRASLGATELRAHASGHGVELARLGLSLAIEDRSARRALAWMERWRAGSIAIRPVRPSDDALLTAECSELRRVTAQLETIVADRSRRQQLLARQVELEKAIRERSWKAAGVSSRATAFVEVDELKRALGPAALIELAELEETLWAVVVAPPRLILRRLCDIGSVRAESRFLRFAMRRLLWGGSDAAVDSARHSLRRSLQRLQELVLDPLADLVAGRDAILVPTGDLHAVPWPQAASGILSSICVAPSAGLWLKAFKGRDSGSGRTVLVAGPNLPAAEREISVLAAAYPHAEVLTGRAATVDRTLAALEGAELAHVAAHSNFRRDNPLFSSISLADGPLMVFDLEQLDHAPRTMVISACESGRSGVVSGDELMGLAACLFTMGTATLIVSLLPVPDQDTSELMLRLHREMRIESSAARALARAQSSTGEGHGGRSASWGSFVCMGAG